MPKEMRKVVFNSSELQAALVNYALRTKQKLPNATIEKVEVVDAEGVTAKVHYSPEASEAAKVVDFDETNLAAALILFCRTFQIPLPREAKKVLVPTENAVAMIVQLEHIDAPGAKDT
ncbi:MAG: hypothetical protein VX617_05965 [Pseudomonadota bacterium]|nr:hypothetical protein [Pseudomonadota bacterium]